MGELRNANISLIQKREGNKELGRPTRRLESYIKMYLENRAWAEPGSGRLL
jgi:hypothetical protein